MKSNEDSTFRLDLAKGYLARAESDVRDRKWDSCLANAQEAVENAGKAILAHFRPPPQTHDVLDPPEKIIKLDAVPQSIKESLSAGLDDFRNMGVRTHIRATYGDESTHTPPWKLIQEREATDGSRKSATRNCAGQHDPRRDRQRKNALTGSAITIESKRPLSKYQEGLFLIFLSL